MGANALLFVTLAVAVAAVVAAADPDPVRDFPANVNATQFHLKQTDRAANLANNGTGGVIYAGNINTFPGLSTQGLSSAYAVLKPGGEHLPHWHFRASELLFLIQGKLEVAIVDSKNQLYTYTLAPKDQLIIPRGAAHSLRNVGDTESINFSAFNSENPGTGVLSTQLFSFRIDFQTNAFQQPSNIVKLINRAKGPGTTPAFFEDKAAGSGGSEGGSEGGSTTVSLGNTGGVSVGLGRRRK